MFYTAYASLKCVYAILNCVHATLYRKYFREHQEIVECTEVTDERTNVSRVFVTFEDEGACAFVCVYVHVRVCVCVYARACVCICVYASACVCVCVCVCSYARECECVWFGLIVCV